MPSMVREYRQYRIAIYSPSGHFAIVTPPGSNRVIDFKDRQARSTVVEGPLVCLDRAQALVDALADRDADVSIDDKTDETQSLEYLD